MKLHVTAGYPELSSLAADKLLSCIGEKASPLICIASGDTPIGTYRKLNELRQSGTLDCSQWKAIALDEWVGLNRSDAGSCGEYLMQHFIKPLQIREDNYFLFDGRSTTLEIECSAAESFIKVQGGIDIAILGLGVNGHIGLNEPGSRVHERTRVTTLQERTAAVGQKYFASPTSLKQGITLGLGDLMEARHLVVIASGEAKAPVIQQLIEGEMSPAVPASLLRSHPSLTVIIDEEAASHLQP
jgi:glucosamine-6-phosphate isomerase